MRNHTIIGTIEHQVGEDRPIMLIDFPGKGAGADGRFCSATKEYFAGTVPVRNFMVAVDHEGSYGAALDDLAKQRLILIECFLRAFLLGDVLQRFYGTDHVAMAVL